MERGVGMASIGAGRGCPAVYSKKLLYTLRSDRERAQLGVAARRQTCHACYAARSAVLEWPALAPGRGGPPVCTQNEVHTLHSDAQERAQPGGGA
jgi:hypothetical protein